MTEPTNEIDADRALKGKHRAMWALGDYPAIASELVADLGPALVDACGVRRGDRVLDVGAGTGNAAIAAARAGATVVASDLTPELLEAGRRESETKGLELEWLVADAEALPFTDGEFDTVLSCIGVMFAPHHQASADELVRVCRPGGTIGLLSWTPEGFIGDLFATMKAYAPPPPPGAQPPPMWGREDHVRDLFADRVTSLKAWRQDLDVSQFSTPEEFRDFFKTRYGPTIAVYKNIAQDSQRVAELDRELVDLARRHDRGDGSMKWEYLVVTAHRQD